MLEWRSSDNKDGVTGSGITGTVKYDPMRELLTLDGATVQATDVDIDGTTCSVGILRNDNKSLYIEVSGVNKITPKGTLSSTSCYGIHAREYCGIGGTGTLEVIAGESEKNSFGIFSDGVSLEDYSDVRTVGGIAHNESCGVYADRLVVRNGGTLKAVGGDSSSFSSGIHVNDIILHKPDAVETIGGTDSGRSYGLFLEKTIFLDPIYDIEYGPLYAKGYTQAILVNPYYGYLTDPVLNVEVSDSESGALVPYTSGENLYGADSAFKQIKLSSPSDTLYPVWVVGKRVTSGNKDDVLGDGKVKYDPVSKKLTLNKAGIYADWVGIYIRDDIGIELVGDNEIIVTENTVRGYSLCGINCPGNLELSGGGNLKVEVGDTIRFASAGISSWVVTTQNLNGELVIKSGMASSESSAISAYRYTHGADATLFASSPIVSSAHIQSSVFYKGVVVDVIALDSSIIVTERAGGYSPVKIDAITLKGTPEAYNTVSIKPDNKLATGLEATVENNYDVEITLKEKDSSDAFTSNLTGLKEDTLITVKAEIKNSDKELDKIVAVNDTTGEENILGSFDFAMPGSDVKVKAVLKDNPGSGSSTGAGGGSSISAVRPPSGGSAKPDDKPTQPTQPTKENIVIVLKIGDKSYALIENGVSTQKNNGCCGKSTQRQNGIAGKNDFGIARCRGKI